MVGVDDHDLAFAVLQVVKAVEKVSDNAIASNHGVGKHGVLVVLDLRVT
jgi:hypothetical protein